MQPTSLPATPAVKIAQNGPYTLSAINEFLKDDALYFSCHARHPKTGKEYAAFSLAKGGFILLDPYTGETRQIPAQGQKPFSNAWTIRQGPEGNLYQVDFITTASMITCWDWTTDESRIVAESPSHTAFDFRAAANGILYIADNQFNRVFRVDTIAGKSSVLADLKGIANHLRHLTLGNDGMLYAKTLSHADQQNPGEYLVMIDPADGKITNLTEPGRPVFILEATADNRIAYATQSFGRWTWRELLHGKFHPVDASTLRITSDNTPLVFDDGTYVHSAIEGEWKCTVVYPNGTSKIFDIRPQGTSIRIFSITSAANKIWAGTFIPLRLTSFDPTAHVTTFYGNPTPAIGEIYALSGNQNTLYFASYPQAWVTRLKVNEPIVKGDSIVANPGQFGRIKDDSLPLHRIYGVTQDTAGRVFFAALGGYGCPDSGICRITPGHLDPTQNDRKTSWIYPETTFGAMCYLPALNRLLVSEFRRHETTCRFTLIDPDTGVIDDSLPMLQDSQNVVSWLPTPDGASAIGVFAYRATLLKFDARTRSITHSLPEVRVGTHCHNALIQGLDGQVWGYTGTQVYKTDWNLTKIETLFDFSADAHPNPYRFGFCKGPDNRLYFPDGTRLLRIEQQ